MKKKLVFIETDASFIQNFGNNLEKEGLHSDYSVIQILPKPDAKKIPNLIIESCVSQVKTLNESADNIYGIFVDICIIDGESSPLGIEISKELRKFFSQTPIFNITNKTKYDSEFDSLSEATLENVDGVLVKSYLEGDYFSKKKFEELFEKAHNKRANTINYSKAAEVVNKKFDIAIITALEDPEFKAVKKIIENIKPLNKDYYNINDNTIYFEGELSGKEKTLRIIAATENKMGMPALTSLATRVITNFSPNYIVILGIAAGIEGETNIGDIMVAEFCWDYGSGKFEEKEDGTKFYPYINQLKLDEGLRNIFLNYKSNSTLLNCIRENYTPPEDTLLKIHLGPFASGAAVISSDKFVENLKEEHKKLIGFDMEAYGVFCSAEAFPNELKPKVIVIKSVSDFGTSKKNNPLKKHHQSYAAYTSCQFFKEFVNHEL